MPPFTGWYLGAENIGELIDTQCPGGLNDMPMIETRANGQPAFGLYMRTPDGRLHAVPPPGPRHRRRRQGRARRRVLRAAAVRDVRAARPAARRLPARRPRPGRRVATGDHVVLGHDAMDRGDRRRSTARSSSSSGRWPTRGSCSPTSVPTTSTAHAVRGLDAWPGCSRTWRTRSTRSPRPRPAGSRSSRCRRPRPGRRAAREGVRPARRLDRGPPRLGRRSATAARRPAAGRDGRPGDHGARLGRRPGDRAAVPRSPTTWPAGCCRSPSRSSARPTAGRGSRAPPSPPRQRRRRSCSAGRGAAFLGRHDWSSRMESEPNRPRRGIAS